GIYATMDGVSWAEDAGLHAVPAESVVANPRTAGTLYIAALGEVQKTVDDGTVWTRSFPAPGTLEEIAVSPRGRPMYVTGFGPTGERLTWTTSNTGIPGNDLVLGAVAVKPQNAANVYVGCFTTGHVLRSDDGGATWGDASSGLPAASFDDGIRALLVDPSDPAT